MPNIFQLSAFMPYRLAVLSERVSRRLSIEYGRTHGLSVAEWRVLVHLQRHGEVSVRDIHNCVNLEKPRVSRAVARLENAGLVQKLGKQSDGRLVAISLTGPGERALAEILPLVTEIEDRLMGQLSPSERETFFAVMNKLHAALDADPKARPRSVVELAPDEG